MAPAFIAGERRGACTMSSGGRRRCTGGWCAFRVDGMKVLCITKYYSSREISPRTRPFAVPEFHGILPQEKKSVIVIPDQREIRQPQIARIALRIGYTACHLL